MLIPLGIILGLVARSILGVPSVQDKTLRLDPYTDLQPVEQPKEKEQPVVQPLQEPWNLIEIPIWQDHRNSVSIPQSKTHQKWEIIQ